MAVMENGTSTGHWPRSHMARPTHQNSVNTLPPVRQLLPEYFPEMQVSATHSHELPHGLPHFANADVRVRPMGQAPSLPPSPAVYHNQEPRFEYTTSTYTRSSTLSTRRSSRQSDDTASQTSEEMYTSTARSQRAPRTSRHPRASDDLAPTQSSASRKAGNMKNGRERDNILWNLVTMLLERKNPGTFDGEIPLSEANERSARGRTYKPCIILSKTVENIVAGQIDPEDVVDRVLKEAKGAADFKPYIAAILDEAGM